MLSSHRVSPVVVFFRPTASGDVAGITISRSSRWFACICRIRPMRSRLLSLVELYTLEPAFSVPEYTRKKHSLPTNGSVDLKGQSGEGSSSEEGRSLLPGVGVYALNGRDISRSRHIIHNGIQQLLNTFVLIDVPQITGTILLSMVA